jgi:hypothetical protein
MRVWVFAGLLLLMKVGRAQLPGLPGMGGSGLAASLGQIAELQALISLTEDGYTISEDGLAAAGAITGKEFDLHQTHLDGLAAVNPWVAGMTEVRETLAYDSAVLTGLSAAIERWKGRIGFSARELELAGSLYSSLTGRVEEDVGELRELLTPDSLVLSDSERMHRVLRLYESALQRWGFVQKYCVQMDLSGLERQKGLR